jgi:RNA polymerase sigma factor (sigma-70 family)
MSPSDGQLLERFAAVRDEAAFEALLARHGPMVWGVCWRALGQRQAAEDAFQATFLVLARRAAAIQRREAVGGWLYSVARRLAIKVKTTEQARRDRERKAADQAASIRDPDDLLTHVVWREIRAVLDEELHCLPKKYRAPLILCYLEGKTHQEAAQELGWPSGSMSKRLARACDMLRERLRRRGLAFSTALVAGALAEHGASAVPPALATATLRAALACVSGKLTAAVAPPVVALTEGVLAAMFLTKLKIAAAVVLALGLSAGLATYGTLAGGQDPVPGSVPVPKGEQAIVVRPFDSPDSNAKKDSAGEFITEIIDPQPKHTLSFPTNYGCVLTLREKPIRYQVTDSTGEVRLERIGNGKKYLLRTSSSPHIAVCHFWFDDPQRWNFHENVFSLTIRVLSKTPTAGPIDPSTYKDVPLIASIAPPQGELTIGYGRTRLLVLKEPLHKIESDQLRLLQTNMVAPKQLLLTAAADQRGFGAEMLRRRTTAMAADTELLTFWFPANPDPEQMEVVNYLVHVVDEAKGQALPADPSPELPPARANNWPQPSSPHETQAITDLANARRDIANELYRARRAEFQNGRSDLASILASAKRLLDAELEAARKPGDRIRAYEDYLQTTNANETEAKKLYEAGHVSLAAYLEARYLHVEAELWLAKEKVK